jgi:hypothetical protein
VVVAGPGLGYGPGAVALVAALRDGADRLVLDADALNVHRDDPAALAEHRGALVLTPHERELARLGGGRTVPTPGATGSSGSPARRGARCDDRREGPRHPGRGARRPGVGHPGGWPGARVGRDRRRARRGDRRGDRDRGRRAAGRRPRGVVARRGGGACWRRPGRARHGRRSADARCRRPSGRAVAASAGAAAAHPSEAPVRRSRGPCPGTTWCDQQDGDEPRRPPATRPEPAAHPPGDRPASRPGQRDALAGGRGHRGLCGGQGRRLRHGAVPVARAAVDAGARWLAVALVEEGIVLREAGIDVPDPAAHRTARRRDRGAARRPPDPDRLPGAVHRRPRGDGPPAGPTGRRPREARHRHGPGRRPARRVARAARAARRRAPAARHRSVHPPRPCRRAERLHHRRAAGGVRARP